ncbi:VOC family protein [Bradyrhizobium australiense]|uniref:VOC family protein n=1 Tax=Bradyrhizobium australiense TaxID=2721161 RepID=UPI001AEE2B18|nr:VOC family protein [Bradyrhizobium australiense]
MEVNGIAHIFLTASNYERSRDFYRKLLSFLALKPVIDTETTYYCVGGRTAVGINAPSAEHEDAAFEPQLVRLHHLCFRARERADVDELHSFLQTLGAKIIRAPREDQWAPGHYLDPVRRSRWHPAKAQSCAGEGVVGVLRAPS